MSYALLAAIPLVLWVASNPLVGAVLAATSVGLFVVARRTRALVRCFYDCREFAFDLGGNVRITVSRTAADDPC